MKVAINGWGRIGRIVFRAALKNDADTDIDFVAINTHAAEASWIAHMLKYDSVHGVQDGEIRAEKDTNTIVVNGKEIKILAETDPEKLPWSDLGVDLIVESPRKFMDKNEVSKHLDVGSKKVIIKAPTKNLDNIISLVNCITNCLALVTKVLITMVRSHINNKKLLNLRYEFPRAALLLLTIIPTDRNGGNTKKRHWDKKGNKKERKNTGSEGEEGIKVKEELNEVAKDFRLFVSFLLFKFEIEVKRRLRRV